MTEKSMPEQPGNQHFDEQATIEQARTGDLEAFNQLVLHYQNYIYTITYRIMGEPDGAADMAQDAFITAFRKLDTYRGGSFKSWLGRIATNNCYDSLRKQQRRPADYLEEMNTHYDEAPIPSPQPSPERTVQNSELSAAIQQCIGNLKDDQRQVMIQVDIQGLSYQEAAEDNQVSLGTVKSRLSRARLAVRRCLQAFQELLPDEYRLSNIDD
jgi:RNA polymerase sigma-70 factor (ECF subfamily)